MITDLVPGVWPAGASRNADGVLTLGGIDVRDLAAEHGTPLLVLDEDDFRARFGRNAELMIAVAGTGLSLLLALWLAPTLALWLADLARRALR
jgi:diaminopimelate decarboxylase